MDTIETKFPDLLSFNEELIHVDRASRVSLDSIQKTLKQMDSSIKNLETDLKNASKLAASEDDKFLEVMGVSFFRKHHSNNIDFYSEIIEIKNSIWASSGRNSCFSLTCFYQIEFC